MPAAPSSKTTINTFRFIRYRNAPEVICEILKLAKSGFCMFKN